MLNITLNENQWALWRAGHAHAGVSTMLSLLLQILLDSARLTCTVKWVARLAVPLAAVVLSGGFFGWAFWADFQWLVYLAVLAMLVALIVTGIGLLRDIRLPAMAFVT